ncbi:MAG: hypothetical protein Q9209_006206 [Squamulea sp. 1 TL-2023]
MPREILRLLWKRQHKLVNIELLPCNKPLDEVIDELGVGGNSFYRLATELRIADSGWGIVPTSALRILKQRPQINTMNLDFWSIRSNLDAVNDSLGNHDNPNSNDLAKAYHENLLKEIFRPSKQLQRASPLAITTLHLHCIDLWYGHKYLFVGLQLRVLKNLHIVSCPRVQNLLLRMSQLPTEKRPQLRLFHIYHEQNPSELTWVSDDNQIDRTIYSVNEFLLSMKDTLHDLWIVMRGLHRRDRLLNPIAPGIANHGSSLLRLTADIRSCEPSHSATTGEQCVGWFPSDTWEELCASMGRLEQLYVPFPPVVADEYMTARQEYHSYLPLDIVGFGLLERNHYMSDLQDSLEPVYFVNPGRECSDKRFPNMELHTYKEVNRTRMGALLSGVVDIDWLAKKVISKTSLTRG